MYCTNCGTESADNARYCRSCGQAISSPTSSANNPDASAPVTAKEGASHQRTAAMILGLIAATFLMITGCTAYVTGSTFEAFDEAFDEAGTTEDAGPGESTPEEVSMAGALALIIAIVLFVGAGLARAAWKPSLALFIVTLAGLVLLVTIDTWSLFAMVYYLGIVLVGVSSVLMWRARTSMSR